MATSSSQNSTNPLVAGFLGGVVSTTLLLPLDVVKVRLQVNETVSTKTNKHRLGTISLLRGIVRHEGLRGVYQGWTPAVVGSAVSWGGYFYFYEGFKRRLVDYRLGTTDSKTPASQLLRPIDNFVLACGAGGVMVAMTNPVWLIKTRIQLQMKRSSEKLNIKPYRGMIDAARTIVREEGPMALYRGSGPALLLTSHGGVQFVVYEYLRRHFHYRRIGRGDGRNKTVMERLELSSGYLTIGAISKITASFATYPLQVIKSRMQQRSDGLDLTAEGEVRAVKRNYGGMVDTIAKMWRREGLRGFFKGIIPNSIRVAPGAAITFVVYESTMDWLSEE